jgi:hypothetical protein
MSENREVKTEWRSLNGNTDWIIKRSAKSNRYYGFGHAAHDSSFSTSFTVLSGMVPLAEEKNNMGAGAPGEATPP